MYDYKKRERERDRMRWIFCCVVPNEEEGSKEEDKEIRTGLGVYTKNREQKITT